jgi:hypothetical protein
LGRSTCSSLMAAEAGEMEGRIGRDPNCDLMVTVDALEVRDAGLLLPLDDLLPQDVASLDRLASGGPDETCGLVT